MAANIQNNSYARAVSNRGGGIVNNKEILMSEMIKQISQINVHLNTLVNSNYYLYNAPEVTSLLNVYFGF